MSVITLRLPADKHERLRHLAERRGISVTVPKRCWSESIHPICSRSKARESRSRLHCFVIVIFRLPAQRALRVCRYQCSSRIFPAWRSRRAFSNGCRRSTSSARINASCPRAGSHPGRHCDPGRRTTATNADVSSTINAANRRHPTSSGRKHPANRESGQVAATSRRTSARHAKPAGSSSPADGPPQSPLQQSC